MQSSQLSLKIAPPLSTVKNVFIFFTGANIDENKKKRKEKKKKRNIIIYLNSFLSIKCTS